MSDGAMTFELDGEVAIVTIDRPAKHNAMTVEMMGQLWEHSDRVAADPAIRAMVLTGAGEKSFSAGGDLQQLLPRLSQDGDDSVLTPDPSQRFFSRVYKPIVAAINGMCIAGGFELMLGTDIRVSSSSAVFGLAEVKWGIIPASGSIVRLPRQVPWAFAMELLMTGDPVSAERALAGGLINEIVEPERVLPRALEIAHRIARNGPLAVQTVKRIAVDSLNLEPGFRLESALSKQILASSDFQEGLAAFAEKREPTFEGK